MLNEINEIPSKASYFLATSSDYQLPLHVPYLGMGSSYFAALAFYYMGIPIQPHLASEYFNYISQGKKSKEAVLISQSGKSSETLWCSSLFEHFTAITNDATSSLSAHPAANQSVLLNAGAEHYSSSKTYINTLLSLFKGFNIDCHEAVKTLATQFETYHYKGKQLADEIFAIYTEKKSCSFFITGNGPNIATALQASLILSESTKLNFHGLPMAQYDHGPKETAKNSVVIQIVSEGPSFDRGAQLAHSIMKAGAHVIKVQEPLISENFSILHNSVPFNFMAYYLSQLLGVKELFSVGNKITEVN
jgi:glucosamine--fructose-6-phosphate aminotransferase (isomerizing)